MSLNAAASWGPPTEEQMELLSLTTVHEAGHAVMRWLVGWPLTAVTAGYGDGFCAGTGRRVRMEDCLMVTLAGPAAETGYNLFGTVDLGTSRSKDLDEARRLLHDAPDFWRMVPAHPSTLTIGECVPIRIQSVEEALARYFTQACERLLQHDELVEQLSDALHLKRSLSARTVAAMCREYDKRAATARQ